MVKAVDGTISLSMKKEKKKRRSKERNQTRQMLRGKNRQRDNTFQTIDIFIGHMGNVWAMYRMKISFVNRCIYRRRGQLSCFLIYQL